MSDADRNYTVTGMTCGHCKSAVATEVLQVPGVARRRRRPRQRHADRARRRSRTPRSTRPSTRRATPSHERRRAHRGVRRAARGDLRRRRARGRRDRSRRGRRRRARDAAAAADAAAAERRRGTAGGAAEAARRDSTGATDSRRAFFLDDGGCGSSPARPASPPAARPRWRFASSTPGARPCATSSRAARVHVIVVRRDLRRYEHLHPAQGPDGAWSVPADACPTPASTARSRTSRTGGERHTLGVDLFVPGDFAPLDAARAAPTTRDGRRLRRRAARATPARRGFFVRRDGRARSPTSSPTSARAATSSRCARATSPTAHVHPEAAPPPEIAFHAGVQRAGAATACSCSSRPLTAGSTPPRSRAR